MRYVWALLLSIVAVWFIGVLLENAIARTFAKVESPCHMTWDNGQPLDAEDCAYMGGEGWDD